jgi:hypothetical protein
MQYALLETNVAREPDRIDLPQMADQPRGLAAAESDVD